MIVRSRGGEPCAAVRWIDDDAESGVVATDFCGERIYLSFQAGQVYMWGLLVLVQEDQLLLLNEGVVVLTYNRVAHGPSRHELGRRILEFP